MREGPPKDVQCAKVRTEAEKVEGLELDPQTNDNNRVKLVVETSAFQLRPNEGQITQLGNQLPNDDNCQI